MRLSILILGRFEVAVDDRRIAGADWRRGPAAGLVKLLAISTGHRIHRERAMAAFWPDLDVEAAGANLRKAVHFARRALGDHELIEVTNDVVSLAPHAEPEIDAERFEAAAGEALRGGDRSELARAADLYGGQLLPDDLYVDWLDAPRRRWQQLYVDVLRAGELWRRLIALDPADEQAQCALMQEALDAGNRGEAIRLFNHLRESLHTELGVGPSAATIALYEKALALGGVTAPSSAERIRASLAWGLVRLQSGEFAEASEIARQTRDLAMGASLAREVGEASALLGLTAMMQQKWPELFRSEFIEWVRARPALVHHVFDGHLCLCESCLCTASGNAQIAESAHELLTAAQAAQSDAGMGLALLLLGTSSLFAGDLDDAEARMTEAERLLRQARAVGGHVLATQRLAEIALERGQNWRANRFIQRGLADAKESWLTPHLNVRLQALAVRVATTPDDVSAAVLAGDRLLDEGACQPCSIALRTASAIALCEAGELEQVNRRLTDAERIAGMWHGGPWAAALWEARGVQRRAQNNELRAVAAFEEAATRYEELGRPSDRARCLARAAGRGD